MSEDDCRFSLLLVSRCTDMFYISFQFCFSDGFFHFPDPYIVIVTLQRCHFYFSEMNPPTTLYCFFFYHVWHYLVSFFSCFSIFFHHRRSILTTTPTFHQLQDTLAAPMYCHHFLSITSAAYTKYISILGSSVSVKDTDCKILHPFY